MKKKWELLFLVVAMLLLTACASESQSRLWLKAPDWSRAQVVGGMGIPDPAPLVVDENGNIYLLFIDGELEALQAQVVALDSAGEPLWQQTFDEILRLPDEPQLVWDGSILHAFWVNNATLFTARLDGNGNILQEPAVLSGDIRVDSYSTAGSGEGKLAVWFSADRRESGLYSADIGLADEPLLIDEEGILPGLRYDQAGTLHAVWAHYPRDNPDTQFYYAAYPDNDISAANAVEVFQTSIPMTANMVGPTMGLDAENVYIYWIEVFRTGLEAGFTQTRYISFPQSNPEQVSDPQETFFPAEHDLDYEPFPQEAVRAGERYSLVSRPSSGLSVYQDIKTNTVQEAELAISFRASINYYWRRSANQVAMLYFQDGRATSYQLLSFTQQASSDPFITSDDDGYLYVTWLESGDVSRFDVYLSATSPEVNRAFNSVTANDMTDLLAVTLFGLLTGMLLAPVFAVLWMLLPMLALALTSVIRRGEQTIRSPGTIISFILAIAVFQVAKIVSLPDILNYVPFSAWLPLPDILEAPLRIIVPLLITIGAAFIAWHFTYRRKTESPLYFIILYAATDALFTMAINGVLFYGAF